MNKQLIIKLVRQFVGGDAVFDEAGLAETIEAEVLQAPPLTCAGCGSTMTDADLAVARKDRGIISCCPDRKMEATPQPPAPCPLEMKLPCDIEFINGKVGKGCTLGTLQLRILNHGKALKGEIERLTSLSSAANQDHLNARLNYQRTIKEQAALIETCETEFFHIKKVCLSEFGLSLVNENVLAAIAEAKP